MLCVTDRAGWARLLVCVCVLQAPRARADALLLCAVLSPSAAWNLYQTCISKGTYGAALAIMYTKVVWQLVTLLCCQARKGQQPDVTSTKLLPQQDSSSAPVRA